MSFEPLCHNFYLFYVQKAGCDNRLGSSMARDKCGICGGDNSNCQTIKEQFPDGIKLAYGQ